MTSAYPAPLDVLIPQAQRLAAELGEVPSRNKLMNQFKIGAKKAAQVRAALTAPDTSSTGTDVAPATETGRRLHAIPDSGSDQPATDDTTPVPSQPDAAMDHDADDQVSAPGDPAPLPTPAGRVGSVWTRRMPRSWPLILLALPAFVAIWSGWVGLGELTGFGPVHPLPGIAAGFTLNTAITLPIGVETYAAYALRVWLAGIGSTRARRFAKYSAIGSLVLGAAGQVAYHLMTASHVTSAPWPITTAVACLPVVVLGFGAALAHLQHHPADQPIAETEVSR